MTARWRDRIFIDWRSGLVVAVSFGLWMLASVPAGLAFHQLVVFAAPGALLGFGASWAAHAAAPSGWSWHAARSEVLWGALGRGNRGDEHPRE